MVNKATRPRRRLYKLHTWVGFHLAWVMALILLTGTFAVYGHRSRVFVKALALDRHWLWTTGR